MVACSSAVTTQPGTSQRYRAGTAHFRSNLSSTRPYASSVAYAVAACRSGALILEADGVVADMHMDGHRVAFNR